MTAQRMQHDVALVESVPVKSVFRDYVSKKKATPGFLEAMQAIDDARLVADDVMGYASSTMQRIDDSIRFGKLKGCTLDKNYIAMLRKWSEEDTDPPIYNLITSKSYMKDRRHMAPVVPAEWLLIEGMQQLDPTEIDTVFRSVVGDLAKEYPDGREFTWHAPFSTTAKMQAMEDPLFSGKDGEKCTVFVIKLTQKQGRDISLYSAYDETEILMPPECRFKVIGAFVKGDVILIHLEELFSNDWVIDLSGGRTQKPAMPRWEPPAPSLPGAVAETCSTHPGEKLVVWCCDCLEAVCAHCTLSTHKGHTCQFAAEAYKDQRGDFLTLTQEVSGIIDAWQSRGGEDVTEALVAIAAQESLALIDVMKFEEEHDADFDGQIKNCRQEIKQLEDSIAQFEIKIAKLEEQRSGVKTRVAEVRDEISNAAKQKSTSIEDWSETIKLRTQSAKDLLNQSMRLISEGESEPVQALRAKKELSELVQQKKVESVPRVPEQDLLVVTENSTPAAKQALAEVQGALAMSDVSVESFNAAVENLKVSDGSLFGKDTLLNRFKLKFPGLEVEDMLLKTAAVPKKAPSADESPEARKTVLKRVLKEGGKRGVDIDGAACMGGLQFFCASVDEPQGDLEMLAESMNAMNAMSDPTKDERMGGSGHVGKMIFSAGIEHLAVVAYVPEGKQAECSSEEWLKTVLGIFNGTVVSAGKTISTGLVVADPAKNVFPLKIREPMILEANNFLRNKGLYPEETSDSDDDYIYGDDDFPS